MTNENTNIQDPQLNTGKSVDTSNSGVLTTKNSMRFLGGLALAGMVAMATTFGSVSADSPALTTSSSVHGPYEMDVEFLNRLGNTHFNLGPDVVKRTSVSAFMNHGPDVIEQTASAYMTRGPDVIEQTASAYINHGPDVVKTASAFLYNFHGPDTTEWIG